MAEQSIKEAGIIEFLRKRDYVFLKELGSGACGKTVLLQDDLIGRQFVCKKYSPYVDGDRPTFFEGFVREIVLLHDLYHENVVRIFNYYLYPEQLTGYILMEHVDGVDIDKYALAFPDQLDSVFAQTIAGFSHLEERGILHRDIRPQNVMVRQDGRVKIIDLGFGKRNETNADFEKSISLNWICETPLDFRDSVYNFGTEVYFVGKLFESILDQVPSDFRYKACVRRMCERDPTRRLKSFGEVLDQIRQNRLYENEFSEDELAAYRAFADALSNIVTKIEHGAKYVLDIQRVRTQLSEVYERSKLELQVLNSAEVVRCFMSGEYFHRQRASLYVESLRDFLTLLIAADDEKARIILSNLHSRLNSMPRYHRDDTFDAGEVPF